MAVNPDAYPEDIERQLTNDRKSTRYDFDGMKNWLDDWACDHDLAHPQAFAEYMVEYAKELLSLEKEE